MSKTLLGISLVAAIVLVGCQKAPTDQVAAAQTALDEARAAEADKYAPDEFGMAQASFSQATEQISQQEEAFFLTRNYGEADRLLKETVAQVETARTAAVANKEKVRQEVEVLTTETQAAIDAAKAILAKAPRGKDTREELAAMQADLDATTAALASAQEMFASGDYLGAKASLTQSMEKANAVSTEVQMAMQKVRGARP